VGSDRIDVGGDGQRRAFVALFDREVEQILRLAEAFAQAADAADDAVQAGAFAAQILSALRIVPDVRVFQLASDFFEALGLRIEVKDTP
jgi:hypothetical protein